MKPRFLKINHDETPQMLVDHEDLTLGRIEMHGNVFINTRTMLELKGLDFTLKDFNFTWNGRNPTPPPTKPPDKDEEDQD